MGSRKVTGTVTIQWFQQDLFLLLQSWVTPTTALTGPWVLGSSAMWPCTSCSKVSHRQIFLKLGVHISSVLGFLMARGPFWTWSASCISSHRPRGSYCLSDPEISYCRHRNEIHARMFSNHGPRQNVLVSTRSGNETSADPLFIWCWHCGEGRSALGVNSLQNSKGAISLDHRVC